MSPTPLDAQVWRSPNAVMALAIAAALLVLSACGGLIYYASVAVNGITQARETRLMQRSVERGLGRLKEDVASVAVWTDAYEFTARRFDPTWANVNYGVYFHQYLHHDLSVVLDAADRPIYASVGGEVAPMASVRAFVAASRPLVAVVRGQAARKIAATPRALAFDRVGAAEAAVRVGSHVYLVSASTVVPEPEYAKPLLAAPEPVVISAVEITGAYLAALDRDYGLKHARLLPPGAAAPAEAILRGADGRPVAVVAWSPERPGVGVYRDAKWPILGLGLLVAAMVTVMILRLRRLAQEVMRARDHAEAGDRAKSDFIANMSHEIRTPLNGVLGMAQAMEAHDLSPDQRERLKVIRESGAVLLGVLNDVLDVSKIEAGKLEISETAFELEELGRRVCAAFQGLAAAKDLALGLEVEAGLQGFWLGDALRIRQVLSNLVSNGLKFTDAGSVTLSIRRAGEGVAFCVADTGAGLTDAQIPGLFEKFVQGDASTTRRHGGTGLGLPISRSLAQMMGGSLEATSRLGEGSVFTLSLPLTRAGTVPTATEAPTPAEAAEAAPQRLRILAAEDNLTNQLVLRALLSPLDADLTLVGNGREALAAFGERPFDVVLMDVQMPELNGIDATRAIRALEAERGLRRTPILAVSANVMTHQVEDYLAAGMDGWAPKPLDMTTLFAALEAALADPAEPAQAVAA